MNTLMMLSAGIKPRQKGSALLISLLVLIAISLMGVTAMNSAILQEKMASGARNVIQAQSGAETALRAGEQYLWWWYKSANGTQLVSDPNGTFGVYPVETESAQVYDFRTTRTWVSDGVEYSGTDLTSQTYGALAQQPRFIIEELPQEAIGISTGTTGVRNLGYDNQSSGSAGELTYYRVTGRSTGGVDGVVRLAESTFTVSR